MAEKSNKQGRFNVMVNQLVMAVGADSHTEQLRRTLAPLNFVQMKVAKTVRDVEPNAQFLVLVVDFAVMPAVQALAKFVSSIKGFSGATAVFAIAPPQLSEQDLLFGVELGIKRTFFGPKRDEEIRSFIKQQALEVTEHGSIAFVESEVLKALNKGAEDALKLQCDKMALMDRDSEDVNRLSAMLYEARSDYKRMEYHLKQTLRINPQNLWAANYLGRYYLRNHKVAEGIEILKKLSRFHELNSERMLALGNAYLNVGRATEAESALIKCKALTDGKDERFNDSLAKVDLLRGNVQEALAKIGKKHLSPPVLAFLNTRGVMATRAGMAEDGIKLYNEAIHGCDPADKLTVAKLQFNIGLAYVRIDQLQKAVNALTLSIELGGREYTRAAKPLTTARQMLLRKTNPSLMVDGQADMDDMDFDSFS